MKRIRGEVARRAHMSNVITCPKCSSEIEITEVMSTQLRARIRGELEAELRPAREAVDRQAAELKARQNELDRARETLDEQVRSQVASQLEHIKAEARSKATEELAVELQDRDAQIRDARLKLKAAQERELEWRKRDRELTEARERLEQEKAALAEQAKEEVARERDRIAAEAARRARDELTLELKDRENALAEVQEKLQAATEAELASRKRERELQERAERIELESARRLDAERQKIREAARKQADEEHELKAREKDLQIEGLLRQINELKRRAEQGSQQGQGEALELALEDLLHEAFPTDGIEEVGKGIGGGDVIQRVRTGGGVECGTILWEAKRTRNWQDGWLAKLRKDQRDAKAAVAVLVSTAMPSEVEQFGLVDGIWVCSWPCARGVATALRAGLLEAAKARQALEGQHGKMEQVYQYLASPQFSNRVGAIMEAFVTMKEDLDAEKRAISKHWAKREKQIEQAIIGTVGMYGDFQGIIGGTLPEIEGMSLPQLETESLEDNGADGDPAPTFRRRPRRRAR